MSLGATLGILFGCFVLFLVATIAIGCCWYKKICPCHEYHSLRRKYNNIEGETMSVEEFVRKRDNIIENLKRSEKQNNYYYFRERKSIKFIMHITDVSIVKEEKSLLTTIKLEGSDTYFLFAIGSKWKALGSIMSKNN